MALAPHQRVKPTIFVFVLEVFLLINFNITSLEVSEKLLFQFKFNQNEKVP